jgi:hypothetical protein
VPPLHIVTTNVSPPPFPLACELCPWAKPARQTTTCRVTFDGQRHSPSATKAERRHHGPGWWLPLMCAQIVDGRNVVVEGCEAAVPTCSGEVVFVEMEPARVVAEAPPSLF